jgi:Uma2 family endonuclease
MAAEIQPRAAVALQRRLLSLREFDLMKEAGIFTEDDRVELLDGKLLAMSTVGGRHTACIVRCDRQLQRGIDPTSLISVQNPPATRGTNGIHARSARLSRRRDE